MADSTPLARGTRVPPATTAGRSRRAFLLPLMVAVVAVLVWAALSCFQVFASAAQVLVLAMAAAYRHAVANGFDVLLHDYGVASKAVYERDGADRIAKETIFSANDIVLRKRIYHYDAKNRVSGIDEFDSEGRPMPKAVRVSPGRPDKKKR